MLYLLDASTLITANNTYYGVESVPEFWEWLQHQAELGHVKIPLEIFEEIKDGPSGSKDLLYGWIQSSTVKKAILLDEEVDDALVASVISMGYANDLTDTELEQMGRDPFLIAYALAQASSRTVVTSEVSKPKKIRQNRMIPNVCGSLGVQWSDPFSFYKILGFTTNWKKKSS